jgi:hypothetical protein
MSYVASENMTATNQGGRIEFYATANGSVASTSIARVATVDPAIGLTSDLGITAVGAVTTQDGITGNSITANTQVVSSGGIVKVAGGTPSVTLNFNTTSMVLIYQPTGTVTFSLGTLVAGSEITCLVNMGATGHNVATGVSATNNSTTGTTTLATTQGGGGNLNNQAVKLVYTCVDGTAANTYVAINYV